MFTGVLAAGHAEAELKVKALEQLLSEVVPLDHPEVVYRHVANSELDAGGMEAEREMEEQERQKGVGERSSKRDKKAREDGNNYILDLTSVRAPAAANVSDLVCSWPCSVLPVTKDLQI